MSTVDMSKIFDTQLHYNFTIISYGDNICNVFANIISETWQINCWKDWINLYKLKRVVCTNSKAKFLLHVVSVVICNDNKTNLLFIHGSSNEYIFICFLILRNKIKPKICLKVWWFSPVSFTNTTDRHYITEILLKVKLNTIILTP